MGCCEVYRSTGTDGLFQRIRAGIRTAWTANNYHIFVIGTVAYEFRIFERRGVGEIDVRFVVDGEVNLNKFQNFVFFTFFFLFFIL